MLTDKPIHLLDIDENFIIVTDNLEVEIEYGKFALSLINTDYHKMNTLIKTYLQNNSTLKLAEQLQAKYANKASIGTDIANIILSKLCKPMKELLESEYLTTNQAKAVTRLLLQEIKINIMNKKIDLSHTTDYLPTIFSNKQLHDHIRESLLMKTSAFSNSIQAQINQLELSTSIQILNDGTAVTVFCLEDTFSYLVVDMQKYLLSKKRLNECKCCGRLFYPCYRKTEIYCRLLRKDTTKTCNQIMLHSKDSDFTKERNKARGYQHNRCYNSSTTKQYPDKFLIQLYDEWSAECTEKYNEYKLKNDLNGFKNWIENTKFKANRIKKLYQEYNET